MQVCVRGPQIQELQQEQPPQDGQDVGGERAAKPGQAARGWHTMPQTSAATDTCFGHGIHWSGQCCCTQTQGQSIVDPFLNHSNLTHTLIFASLQPSQGLTGVSLVSSRALTTNPAGLHQSHRLAQQLLMQEGTCFSRPAFHLQSFPSHATAAEASMMCRMQTCPQHAYRACTRK